jgi:uncharacterized protein YfbU (UPF0304 family)
MKIKNVYLSLILVLIFSCNTPPEEAKAFDQTMTEAIQIHDDVMPEMGRISKLIKALETKVDSTNADVYKPAIRELKQGHDMMMDWMKDFGDEFSKTEINDGIQIMNVDSLKARLKAIEKSKNEAEKMKTQVMSAIENAEALLKE